MLDASISLNRPHSCNLLDLYFMRLPVKQCTVGKSSWPVRSIVLSLLFCSRSIDDTTHSYDAVTSFLILVLVGGIEASTKINKVMKHTQSARRISNSFVLIMSSCPRHTTSEFCLCFPFLLCVVVVTVWKHSFLSVSLLVVNLATKAPPERAVYKLQLMNLIIPSKKPANWILTKKDI